MSLILLFVVVFGLAGLAQLYATYRISKLRKEGIYPPKGKATISAVIRLRDAGLNTWAIRCYREIHKVSLKEAKSGVFGLVND